MMKRLRIVRSPCAAVRIVFVAAALAVTLPAQPVKPVRDPLFRDVRIALRFGSDQVLLIGGEIPVPSIERIVNDISINKFPESVHYARLQPDVPVYVVPPQFIARFEFQPDTKWQIGDRWKVYPGAGPPVPVVIREFAVILACVGIGGYAAAIADFENPDAANSIAGLRAGEYLASPDDGLAAVSGMPMMPVWEAREIEQTMALGRLLFSHARGTVKSDDWMTGARGEERLQDRIRQMNRLFLAGSKLEPVMRYFRWSPPGRPPLLFVEALWTGAGSLPLFACSAVVEQGNALTILSFDQIQASYMRMGEFANRRWELQEPGAFLNAWKIGNRYFVLTHRSGYEGF